MCYDIVVDYSAKFTDSRESDKIPLILSDGKIIAVPGICVSDTHSGKDLIITIFERKQK